MGLDLVTQHPDVVRPLFDHADEVLGFSLSRLCFEGPAEELRRTDVTQPAVFLVSLALYEVIKVRLGEGMGERLPPFHVTAGHSLGEYTALTIAGALDWADALALVRRRGELMAEANRLTPGTMLAVIGVDADTVERACEEVRDRSHEVIEVANYNDDSQTVVSGTIAGAEAFREVMKGSHGATAKIVPLDVGAPFHSSLMREVEQQFSPALDGVHFSDPRIPVVTGVDGAAVTTAAAAKAALTRQLVGAVRWRRAMSTMASMGVTAFVEVGPGRVLTGLCKHAYPDLNVHSVSDARRAERFVNEISATTRRPPDGTAESESSE